MSPDAKFYGPNRPLTDAGMLYAFATGSAQRVMNSDYGTMVCVPESVLLAVVRDLPLTKDEGDPPSEWQNLLARNRQASDSPEKGAK